MSPFLAINLVSCMLSCSHFALLYFGFAAEKTRYSRLNEVCLKHFVYKNLFFQR